MLILTRRVGETLVIGENEEIRITITGMHGHQVKVAIEAPRHIPVHREEIAKRISDEKVRLAS